MTRAIAPILLASAALAHDTTLVHQGRGTGSLAGVPFSDAEFTIHAHGDNDEVKNLGFGFAMVHHEAIIHIDGIGEVEFLVPTQTFVSHTNKIVGFQRADGAIFDLFDGPTNPIFAFWDFSTPVDQVTGTGMLIQWGSPKVLTSGGVLHFEDNFEVDAAFSAIIPSPAGLAIIAPVAMAIARRRR